MYWFWRSDNFHLAWSDEDAIIWFAGEVLHALHGAVVLPMTVKELDTNPFPRGE